jgi:hypothetical protein
MIETTGTGSLVWFEKNSAEQLIDPEIILHPESTKLNTWMT